MAKKLILINKKFLLIALGMIVLSCSDVTMGQYHAKLVRKKMRIAIDSLYIVRFEKKMPWKYRRIDYKYAILGQDTICVNTSLREDTKWGINIWIDSSYRILKVMQIYPGND